MVSNNYSNQKVPIWAISLIMLFFIVIFLFMFFYFGFGYSCQNDGNSKWELGGYYPSRQVCGENFDDDEKGKDNHLADGRNIDLVPSSTPGALSDKSINISDRSAEKASDLSGIFTPGEDTGGVVDGAVTKGDPRSLATNSQQESAMAFYKLSSPCVGPSPCTCSPGSFKHGKTCIITPKAALNTLTPGMETGGVVGGIAERRQIKREIAKSVKHKKHKKGVPSWLASAIKTPSTFKSPPSASFGN